MVREMELLPQLRRTMGAVQQQLFENVIDQSNLQATNKQSNSVSTLLLMAALKHVK
jgi:hypothetical protein